MSPVLRAILLSWDFRLDIVLVLLLTGGVYTLGWLRLRKRGRGVLASRWRLVSYLGGLVAIALALLSAIDVIQSLLFFMHMIQHLLLVMIAPPLLLLGSPMVFLLWGLPARWRWAASGLLARKAPFRQGFRRVTTPAISWFLFVIILIGWHDPNAYNAALKSEWVHDLEHLTFFVSGMLFWWHVVGAAPRIHRHFTYPFRIVYLLGALPFNMFLGVVLAFASEPYYSHYTTVPRLWGVTALADQQIGGVIMWVPGSMMYLIAIIILVARLLDES